MIRKLRHRFIAITMLSTTLVLAIIIGTINIVNYVRTYESIDTRMEMIASASRRTENTIDEFFPKPGENMSSNVESEIENGNLPFRDKDFMDKLNKEAAFDTRYFSVTFDSDGNLVNSFMDNISAIDETTAVEYAASVWDKGKSKGNYGIYRYESFSLNDGNIRYMFLDIEREQTSLAQYLLASIMISIAGLILVFLLVVLLSRRVTKPIAESYEKQKRFITDASHEIKTPLTIIDANTEVMEMMKGEDEWTKSTRKQVARLAALTEKLVFLSRMDEENSNYLEMMDFNLSEAMLDTAETFLSVAATKNKKLEIDIQPGIIYQGDEGYLRQLLSLLMDNAMKYSNEGGSIRVSLSLNGKNKILTVWNTTEPMNPGKYDILFERFYRQDASHNSKTGGFGIGLSVVYAIVQAHKGKITAKSEDGQSLLFKITL